MIGFLVDIKEAPYGFMTASAKKNVNVTLLLPTEEQLIDVSVDRINDRFAMFCSREIL